MVSGSSSIKASLFSFAPYLLRRQPLSTPAPEFHLRVNGLYAYEGSHAPEVYADGCHGENYFYDKDVLNVATGVKLKRTDNIEIICEFSLTIKPSCRCGSYFIRKLVDTSPKRGDSRLPYFFAALSPAIVLRL